MKVKKVETKRLTLLIYILNANTIASIISKIIEAEDSGDDKYKGEKGVFDFFHFFLPCCLASRVTMRMNMLIKSSSSLMDSARGSSRIIPDCTNSAW